MAWLRLSGTGGGPGPGSFGGSFWGVSGQWLYPNSTSYGVLVGLTASDVVLGSSGVIARDSLFAVNASQDAVVIGLKSTASGGVLSVDFSGAGSFQPLKIQVGGAERVRFPTTGGLSISTGGTIQWALQAALRYSGGHLQGSDDGATWVNLISATTNQWTLSGSDLYPNSTSYIVLAGLTSTDFVPGTSAFIAKSDIGVVLAVSDSGYLGLKVTPSAAILTSSITGAGTYLPLTVQVNGGEVARFLTAGTFLVGRTTDDTTGGSAQFQNNISFGGAGYLYDRGTGDQCAALLVQTGPRGYLTLVNFSGAGGTSIYLDSNSAGSSTIFFDSVKSFRRLNSTTLQWSNDGSTWNTFTQGGVTSVSASGAGISVSPTTGAVLVSNTGVTSVSAGTAISLSASTGSVTITNAGVTALTGTLNQVSVSSSTGSITLTLPQNIDTAATVTFRTLTLSGSLSGTLLVSTGGITAGTGGSGGFYVGSTQVIDTSARFSSSAGILCSGGNFGIDASGNVAAAGWIDSNTNFRINATFIGVSGETVTTSGGTRNIRGGIITST